MFLFCLCIFVIIPGFVSYALFIEAPHSWVVVATFIFWAVVLIVKSVMDEKAKEEARKQYAEEQRQYREQLAKAKAEHERKNDRFVIREEKKC